MGRTEHTDVRPIHEWWNDLYIAAARAAYPAETAGQGGAVMSAFLLAVLS